MLISPNRRHDPVQPYHAFNAIILGHSFQDLGSALMDDPDNEGREHFNERVLSLSYGCQAVLLNEQTQTKNAAADNVIYTEHLEINGNIGILQFNAIL